MMIDNKTRGNWILIYPMIVSCIWALGISHLDVDDGIDLLFPKWLGMLSVTFFYISWKVYHDKKTSFEPVIFWSMSAMMLMMIDLYDISKTTARILAFLAYLFPILLVSFLDWTLGKWIRSKNLFYAISIVFVLTAGNWMYRILDMRPSDDWLMLMIWITEGIVWCWLMRSSQEKKNRRSLCIWTLCLVLFPLTTMLTEASHWIYFYYDLSAIMITGFPVFCMCVKGVLEKHCSDDSLAGRIKYGAIYYASVLLIMWIDYGIGKLILKPEQANVDYILYYFLMANVVFGNPAFENSGEKRWKSVGISVLMNAAVWFCSPAMKELYSMIKWLKKVYPWGETESWHNSIVLLTDQYGIVWLFLMIVCVLVTCIYLWKWKGNFSRVNQLIRYLVFGYMIRMILVSLQCGLRIPHMQLAFPFYGTGMFDLAILAIVLWEYQKTDGWETDSEVC